MICLSIFGIGKVAPKLLVIKLDARSVASLLRKMEAISLLLEIDTSSSGILIQKSSLSPMFQLR